MYSRLVLGNLLLEGEMDAAVNALIIAYLLAKIELLSTPGAS